MPPRQRWRVLGCDSNPPVCCKYIMRVVIVRQIRTQDDVKRFINGLHLRAPIAAAELAQQCWSKAGWHRCARRYVRSGPPFGRPSVSRHRDAPSPRANSPTAPVPAPSSIMDLPFRFSADARWSQRTEADSQTRPPTPAAIAVVISSRSPDGKGGSSDTESRSSEEASSITGAPSPFVHTSSASHAFTRVCKSARTDSVVASPPSRCAVANGRPRTTP